MALWKIRLGVNLTKKLPEKLFHYTSTTALVNILKSSSIWLSDYNFLNDPKEFLFSREALKAALLGLDVNIYLAKLYQKNCPVHLLTEFRLNFERFSNGLYGLQFEPKAGHIEVIACFSDQEDSLPQWRAYGNQEVCIEFSRGFFEKLQREPGKLNSVRFLDVIYDEPLNLQQQLRVAAEQLLEQIVSQTTEFTANMSMFQLWLPNDPGPLFHKNVAFEAEGEWRLAAAVPNIYVPGGANLFDFRSSSGRLTPYCTAPLDLPTDIVGIKFGPAADPYLVEYLNRLFSRGPYTGQGPKWNLSSSRIPYRTI